MASRGLGAQPRGKLSGLPFHARFTDVAAHAGLRAPVIYGPDGHVDYILESMGCGVAFLDYDNDGFLDIYVTNYGRWIFPEDHHRVIGDAKRNLALYASPRSIKTVKHLFYHNNGNLTFTDVARETGTWETGWGWGAKFFDYDNDGWLDLYVVNGWVSAGPQS